MRAILVLLGLICLGAVVMFSLGMLRVDVPKEGMMPTVSVNLSGGKLPEVKTGSVEVTTTNATVAVPTVEMKNTTVTLPTIEVKKAPAASPTPAPAH
ncbi:hypothetical protein [Sphingomonas sp.]|uniref:hypothetical protein n=1 Tax=Sphingomonas sp. TaxID=28214 RepID=UPI001B055DD6|nr:hypothetical protein [Sphingomonas sp.]MBO9713143.1 hypothetical protein [Sphingomonas sp.]